MEFAVFDTETTGLDPRRGARLLEVGVVRVDATGRELGRWSTLIDPGPATPLGPVEIHGITRQDLAGAPSFAQVAGDFIDAVTGAHLVAHNAPFDAKFLAAEFATAGIVWPDPPLLCTLAASRRLLDLPNHKLATVAAALGVTFAGRAHSALDDAAVTAGVLTALLGRLDRSAMRWPPATIWPPVAPSLRSRVRATAVGC